MSDRESFILEQARLIEARSPHAVVTVTGARGSIPQVVGAKALVDTDGLRFGTVGGGKVEAFALRQAQGMLAAGESNTEVVRLNLNRDLGMTCGGEVTLLFDLFCGAAQWTCTVFGAGHVAQALVPLLLQVGCRVIAVDSRRDWLERLPSDSPLLEKHCVEDMRNVLPSLPRQSQVVAVTKGHATDLPILQEALSAYDFPYVGAIGSQSKAASLKKRLNEAGVPSDRIASLFCPIGLPLGRSTPPEIAISIVAQLIWQRDRALGIVAGKWPRTPLPLPTEERPS